MEKINSLTSADIVANNIQTLLQLFPTIAKEGAIDFNELKALLGETIEDKEEYYRFTWAGKSQARLEANKPTTATLRPCKEDSKDWDTTSNIFIEGDNLEVLKLLQKSYANKIKMIYIDPPYNTGKDFVYKDNYADNLGNYLKLTGQTDDAGKKLSTNTESDGRYHSNWLNMMYPRLRLARNLLADDGVICISIDEIEFSNLRKVCDEIFGEDNHIADFVWQNKKGGGNDSKYVAVEHEYVIMYAKNEVNLHNLFEPYKPSYLSRYKEEDKDGKYFWDTFRRKSGKQFYPVTCPDGSVLEFDELNNPISWLRSETRFLDDVEKGEIRFIKINNKWSIHFKQRLPEGKKPRSIFLEESIWSTIGTTSSGSDEVLGLFGKNVFSNPKPIGLIRHLLSFNTKENDLILDFFAGSGTTSEALFRANSIDGSKRNFILVQLNEPISEVNASSDADKITIRNAISILNELDKKLFISEITKERIRRAGEKIKLENKDKESIDKLDIGFKAFRLDSSNIQAWDGNPDNLAEQLDIFENNIKTDRSEEDILFEILLKYGLDLTVPIEEKLIAGKKVFSVGQGTLFICLSDGITPVISEGIGAWRQELNSVRCTVIFKDTGFQSDKDKTNAMQILKRFGIEEINSI